MVQDFFGCTSVCWINFKHSKKKVLSCRLKATNFIYRPFWVIDIHVPFLVSLGLTQVCKGFWLASQKYCRHWFSVTTGLIMWFRRCGAVISKSRYNVLLPNWWAYKCKGVGHLWCIWWYVYASLQIIFVHKQVICQARVKFWPDKKPVWSDKNNFHS